MSISEIAESCNSRIKALVTTQGYPKNFRSLVSTMKLFLSQESARSFEKNRIYEERLAIYNERREIVIRFDSQEPSEKVLLIFVPICELSPFVSGHYCIIARVRSI